MVKKLTLIVVLLAFSSIQFHNINALEIIKMMDQRIFGHLSSARIAIVNANEAQDRFIAEENEKINKPKILEEERLNNEIEINKWNDYYQETNIIMKFSTAMIIKYFIRKDGNYQRQIKKAKKDQDNEPFCHKRYHNSKSSIETECFRAFQHSFFKDREWELTDKKSSTCSKITILRIEDNKTLYSNREAKKCSAKTKDEIFFNVYLVAGVDFLEKGIFSFYVLLHENARKNEIKASRYMAILKETKVNVSAYIVP